MKRTCSLLILLLIMAGITTAQNMVMKIDGVPGESLAAKFKDKTELLAFILEGTSPQAIATGGGMAAGKRSYKPVIILKQSGAASPVLFQNFYMGRMIKDVAIEFYKQDRTGVQTLDYVITLRNVNISGFKQFSGSVKNEKFNVPGNTILYDEIEFSFREIVVDHKRSGVIVQDNLPR
ncbi:Hcp family type VI secretion system effector [Terrimonas pollutisoli]|uniref:Hcp family type VI secretion system effector n=1 Tax=Terrimonas pollutisoli TaxID=3034147 RepID=UPI0023ECA7CB|nr:type VI secretion system tube protein Hcp [Terrimonas sp. H1YJ31]